METGLPKKIEKPWGYELLLAHTPKYVGKLLFVKKGHRLSLQYHKKKDESIYVHEGEILLDMGGQDGKLTQAVVKPGTSFHFPPQTRHRIKALEDTTLFEASTPELEHVVRLADDYGRESKGKPD